MTDAPDLSVVVPTFNRGRRLETLLVSLLAQEPRGVRFEVVVVDNNSSDNTRDIVQAMAARAPAGHLRHVFEPRQGVSHARNTGVASTTAPIIAFLDDDGEAAPDWVWSMKQAFDEHPEADCIGGRVVARWVTPRPSWLTAAHSGPIAVQDRPNPAYLNAKQASACLLGANVAFRREVFDLIGGFSPDYPRNQDRELELRLWRAGRQGLYLPGMEVTVEVPADRLERRYHRRWQATTGKYHALMRFRDTLRPDGALIEEQPGTRRILGSPLFLYREFLQHLGGYVRAAMARDGDLRFFHETRLWYYAGFFRARLKMHRAAKGSSPAPAVPRLR